MRTVLPAGVFSAFLDCFSRHRLNVVRLFFFLRNVNFFDRYCSLAGRPHTTMPWPGLVSLCLACSCSFATLCTHLNNTCELYFQGSVWLVPQGGGHRDTHTTCSYPVISHMPCTAGLSPGHNSFVHTSTSQITTEVTTLTPILCNRGQDWV